MPRCVIVRADERNLRHEVFVSRPVDERPEENQQTRHHNERRQKREANRLNEANGHIRTEPELHEEHRDQAADGGKRACADFRNGFTQRENDRLADGKRLMLLFKAVAEDDGVVDGQRQLQNARNRVRHEGDLAKQVVRALIDDHANAERQDQNRNLAVGLGREEQHRDNDDCDIDHDHVDLALDRLGLRIAKVCLDVDVLSA